MWTEIFRFEIKHHLKQPLFYVTALALAFIALTWISSNAGVASAEVSGNVNRNAPIVVIYAMSGMTALGLFVVTAFVASSVLRDFKIGSHPLFFSKPIKKFDYLIGRFAGSMAVSFMLMLCVALGMALARFAPWQEADSVGPFMPSTFLFGLAVMVLPNLLMMGAIVYAIAARSRSLLVTYVGVIVFVALQDLAEITFGDFEHATAGALVDPLGVIALRQAARYWTIVEYNTALPPLSAGLLLNRLLWVGVGFSLLALCYARFSYARATAGKWWARRRIAAAPSPAAAGRLAAAPSGADATSASRPSQALGARAARSFSAGTVWRQLIRQTRFETAAVMKSVPFIILLILGLIFVVTTAGLGGQIRGTSIYPVTHQMVRVVEISMSLFLLITLTFYGGELVWRDRSLKLNGVCDALPVPNGVFLGAKILTLCMITATFLLAGILSTIALQISQGFFRIQPGLYIRGFLVIGLPFVLMAILALFFQVVLNNKFLGYLAVILFILARAALPVLGFEHHLVRYPGHTGIRYSDMNGYGHYLEPYLWFKLYWGFAAVFLVILSLLLWVRGNESAIKVRLAIARARWRGRARAFAAIAAAGFLASGAYIFYNTNILNEYVPQHRAESLRAEYEMTYSRYRDLPQPRITDIYADVDIFPRERRVEIRGSYRLENKTDAPIPALHVLIDPEVRINAIGPHGATTSDPNLGYYIHELPNPIAPGESLDLQFDLTIAHPGFVNRSSDNLVVHNGTFFNSRQYFPSLGYAADIQLVDRQTRRKHDLPPAPRMRPVDDLHARRNTYVANDADWINFETIVSTSAGQIAIAPGYLQREWEEDGRRYFHYRMDAPILKFFSYLSADYTVKRDQWNDVAIEVYYHGRHDYNVDRMIDAVKKSLEYYTASFGPYQHRQVRIVEFPAYRTFAQSFPNTIPYSEAAGFIARIGSEEDIDYVFNTTAHEVAHQWWAHQVIGGDVQGSTLLAESLSEYSSLMVMEKNYGADRMRRFLRYELDGYLRGRGSEVVDEMPLMLVENQTYIHYNKGSMIFYALRDYIGEENLNRALARYVKKVAFQDPPYTNSLELLDHLREVTPPDLEYMIEDFFETITLYSNRVESASYARLGDGRYRVEIEVEARKFRADGQGVETETGIDDWIDIGVFGEEPTGEGTDEKVLFLEKRRISEPRASFEIVVDERPVQAGIDPYNKLIDRDADDNVKKVSEASK
jgi:hypothetical protein